MENYEKGEVQELEDKSTLTISESTLRMHVNSGSKIKNLMGFAMNKMKASNMMLYFKANGMNKLCFLFHVLCNNIACK